MPCKSLTENESLLLHAMTDQSRDSACDSLICTYYVALGNKSKDSMIAKTTYINDINNREDRTMLFKVYSKLNNSFAVLRMQFASMDQVENNLACYFQVVTVSLVLIVVIAAILIIFSTN